MSLDRTTSSCHLSDLSPKPYPRGGHQRSQTIAQLPESAISFRPPTSRFKMNPDFDRPARSRRELGQEYPLRKRRGLFAGMLALIPPALSSPESPKSMSPREREYESGQVPFEKLAGLPIEEIKKEMDVSGSEDGGDDDSSSAYTTSDEDSAISTGSLRKSQERFPSLILKQHSSADPELQTLHDRLSEIRVLQHLLPAITLLSKPEVVFLPREAPHNASEQAHVAYRLAKDLGVANALQARCAYWVGLSEYLLAEHDEEGRLLDLPESPESWSDADGRNDGAAAILGWFERALDAKGTFREGGLAEGWVEFIRQVSENVGAKKASRRQALPSQHMSKLEEGTRQGHGNGESSQVLSEEDPRISTRILEGNAPIKGLRFPSRTSLNRRRTVTIESTASSPPSDSTTQAINTSLKSHRTSCTPQNISRLNPTAPAFTPQAHIPTQPRPTKSSLDKKAPTIVPLPFPSSPESIAFPSPPPSTPTKHSATLPPLRNLADIQEGDFNAEKASTSIRHRRGRSIISRLFTSDEGPNELEQMEEGCSPYSPPGSGLVMASSIT